MSEGHRVAGGDGVYFLADSVCHRAPPPSPLTTSSSTTKRGAQQQQQLKERRLLFWFSWDAVHHRHGESTPDVDFQLNPWTLHHLLYKSSIKYENSVVSIPHFLLSSLID